MNKKLTAALSGGAALVLALTGCSSDDDSGEKTDAWAKKVCDQVKPQVTKIQKANASINEASQQKKSPEEVKKIDSAAFQNISEAYKALADAVDDAGEPPVDKGKKLQTDAVKELRGLSTQYAGLKTTVDEMSTKDQADFASGLKELATKLGKLGKSGDVSLQKLQSGDLGTAMAEQKGCKRPATGAPPSA
ncbi:small secreted protein [Streptomyces sp. N2-109]|uniref:Small secreted protein n=1 Tax=Streptomyces gossypii TaxID=2883101 RepID=A0ABT2JQ34_9ACTN|nr:small secreted protein [Streptomyces gossypii]MCT2589921.1 small secreted protein [Streptomyces gossypii]